MYCVVSNCIVSYRIVLYCIVLYCIVLYCIIVLLYCIVLYCIILCCIVSYCIVLYCIVLICIVLYCIVLYCIVLYCIVLYCIVLYCVALRMTVFIRRRYFFAYPIQRSQISYQMFPSFPPFLFPSQFYYYFLFDEFNSEYLFFLFLLVTVSSSFPPIFSGISVEGLTNNPAQAFQKTMDQPILEDVVTTRVERYQNIN